MLNRLPFHRSFAFDSLIKEYVSSGQFDLAFRLYEQMHDEGSLCVSPLTLLKLVQACTQMRDLQRGQKFHAEVSKLGLLDRDLFVGSALVEFHANFGCLYHARAVFDQLPFRDVVVWTALIEAYTEQGRGAEALVFFRKMQEDGIAPDVVAFVCSLKACASIQAVIIGEILHQQIISMGLESNSLVSNTLVDLYIKCDLIAQARAVFDKLSVRDVVTWNVLAMGYVEHGHGEMTLKSFQQMQLEGISPDEISFISSLRACSTTQAVDSGQDIHLLTVKLGLEGKLFVSNTLVDMYAKCGWLVEAEVVFDKVLPRDEVSWNVLLLGYAEHGCGEEALECYEHLQREGLLPHIAMLICVLKVCGTIKTTRNGEKLYCDIVVRGLEGDTTVCNSLISMYANCDALVEAEYVFNNTVYKSDVSWSTIITAYWDRGSCEEALQCYQKMQESSMNPGSITIVCCLKACGSLGAVHKGQEIHTWASLLGIEKENFVGNTLVDTYSKWGCISDAQDVFDNLFVRDNFSWNAILTGWAQLGHSKLVFGLFERMLEEEINPDFFTFVNLLNVCCHAGLLEEGQVLYHAMGTEFGVVSTSEHHSCMVNLFGRAGLVNEASGIMNSMPCQPTLLFWHTLLGACQKWGSLEVAKEAFGHASQLDEADAAAYCCMCNIYVGNDVGVFV